MASKTTLQDLPANPGNPRLITPEKLEALKRSLKEFGDLGCIVFNRKTKRLVGGHQRVKAFPKGLLTVEKSYRTPTKTGTVAEGYVELPNGERLKYRAVSWSEEKEKAAAIAANQNAGVWDEAKLLGWLDELDLSNFDVSLTLFDGDEIEGIRSAVKRRLKAASAPKVKDDGASAGPKTKKRIQCPECQHKFIPGWVEE